MEERYKNEMVLVKWLAMGRSIEDAPEEVKEAYNARSEYLKNCMPIDPPWQKWVFKGVIRGDAPEDVKQAYDEYIKKQRSLDSKGSKA